MTHHCDSLDTYLRGELPTAAAAQFALHLQHCDDCREAIAQQRWIDGLLSSPAAWEVESPPDDTLLTLRASIVHKRRQARTLAVGLAAAAALLVAAGWIIFAGPQSVGQTARESRQSTTEPQATLQTVSQPGAIFIPGEDTIAIPMESKHPGVTVVRVYPTFQPKFDTATAAIEPVQTINNDLSYYSNGG